MASNNGIKILNETKLIYDGIVYVKYKLSIYGKTYWKCKNVYSKQYKVNYHEV